MIEALRVLYLKVKAAIVGTLLENTVVPTAATGSEYSVPASGSTTRAILPTESMGVPVPASTDSVSTRVPAITNEFLPAPAGLEEWSVHPYVDPVFEKVGRVFLDAGDLVIRSDRDSRGFLLSEDDVDKALTGGSGTVRLLDLTATVGTAHLSTSGLALNMVIDQQLHTVPLRSLIPVLNGNHRKAPLFVPKDDVAPDAGG